MLFQCFTCRLFSQILIELTKLYGLSNYSMQDVYSELQRQPFPCLGETLEISATKFEYHLKPNRIVQRRPSLFLQTLQRAPSCGGLFRQNSLPQEPVSLFWQEYCLFEWTPSRRKERWYPVFRDFALHPVLAFMVTPPSRKSWDQTKYSYVLGCFNPNTT